MLLLQLECKLELAYPVYKLFPTLRKFIRFGSNYFYRLLLAWNSLGSARTGIAALAFAVASAPSLREVSTQLMEKIFVSLKFML